MIFNDFKVCLIDMMSLGKLCWKCCFLSNLKIGDCEMFYLGESFISQNVLWSEGLNFCHYNSKSLQSMVFRSILSVSGKFGFLWIFPLLPSCRLFKKQSTDNSRTFPWQKFRSSLKKLLHAKNSPSFWGVNKNVPSLWFLEGKLYCHKIFNVHFARR